MTASAVPVAARAPVRVYAGLATRTLAFAADAVVVNGIALTVGVLVGLGLSVLHLPSSAQTAIVAVGGAMYLAWSAGYFIFFWSTTGQTPGDRLMRIAVVDASRQGRVRPARAALRLVGLMLAALPLLAGVWMMLWDRRCRGLHDRIARTLVVHELSSGGR